MARSGIKLPENLFLIAPQRGFAHYPPQRSCFFQLPKSRPAFPENGDYLPALTNVL
jgi:hypothetical protein